ncbi:MAG: helix-turn-helix domain-containing protein [Oscillospiraceae bacterium]
MSRLSFLYQSDLPSRAVAVYMYLSGRADKDGKCYPAIPTIAREIKLSKSTVKRAIADLEKAGYLTHENRYRQSGAKSSNLYYLKK